MKISLLIGAAITGLAMAATSSHAQISDSDSSAAVLAAYCASSSGLPASNFDGYCKELALTLSQLPVTAQSRVFEEKMPNGGGNADSGNDSSGRQNGNPNASEQGKAHAAGNSAVGRSVSDSSTANQQNSSSNKENGNSDDSNSGNGANNRSILNGLIEAVGAINEFLFG